MCDWSSDVCSSDLRRESTLASSPLHKPYRVAAANPATVRDRKSVVEGQRGDLGGRRSIKKKKKEEIGDGCVTGVQTCALPILGGKARWRARLYTSRTGSPRQIQPPCEIGRASWRDRGEISGGGGALKKKRKRK